MMRVRNRHSFSREQNIAGRVLSTLLLLSLLLAGCAKEEPEETPDTVILTEETVQGHAATGAGAAELRTPEVETAVREEVNFFLEEGCGFALESLSPGEQIWYRDMEQILGGYQSEVELSGEGLETGLTEENIDRIFQCVLNDHPELFFVEGYSYTKYTRYGHEEEIASIEFSGRYSMDLEMARLRREQIQEAVAVLLTGISPQAGDYEKVKYVYDTLIRETDYQLEAPDNQNIYSVFVNHVSVCQGYAKATQYLLNRLGVECALVLGTVGNGEGHAWNLVKVEDSYYYVDTTWGDASYQLEEDGAEGARFMPEVNYDYLNVTTEELLRTHTLSNEVVMPECSATGANYYVREGALFEEYDREQMTSLFARSLEQGRGDVTVKCATWECYQEVSDALIGRQEIFKYLSGLGDTIAYSQNDTQRSLTFWVTNEQ